MPNVKKCHAHNLVVDKADAAKPFGIRVTLPTHDTFRAVLGENWETYHWFESEPLRDSQMEDMQRQHEYSRAGDRPTVLFTAVQRDGSGNIDPR